MAEEGIDYDRLLKLRLLVGRVGEMDLAKMTRKITMDVELGVFLGQS